MLTCRATFAQRLAGSTVQQYMCVSKYVSKYMCKHNVQQSQLAVCCAMQCMIGVRSLYERIHTFREAKQQHTVVRVRLF